MPRTRLMPLVAVVIAAAVSTGTATAEESSMVKDLAATIALHGLPCDKVVDARRNADSDYTATCQNGNRYHVFVDQSGRVVVQKL
jgi:hypothetical protein